VHYLKQAVATDEVDMAEVRDKVAAMLADLAAHGEEAVRRYATELDGDSAERFRVDDAEVDAAVSLLAPEVRQAIDAAIANVRGFAEQQRATLVDLEVESQPGVVLGHRHLPVGSVGCYVPGGRYSLIASAYMSVVPARVAGVERVVVATPPSSHGRVHPGILYAASAAGADSVWAIGGVQAMASMALGLVPGLEPVDMIVGPGNRFVVEAKRQLFGQVGIDLLAGPTEIGILADDTADPFLVCCDLVGQAEHDPLSRAVLITTSKALGEAVVQQIDDHLKAVATEEVARQCWEHGGEVVVVASRDEMASVSDTYALEHVELHVEDPDELARRLRAYGSLFIGPQTTVAYGDKVSGPNHILPTRRSARFTGGLWVGKFLRTVTYQQMTWPGSLAMAVPCAIEAEAEGMVAHARTATVRMERFGSSSG